jgi:regulatory protein
VKITGISKLPDMADIYVVEFESGHRLKVHINLIADFSLFTGREMTAVEYENLERAAEKNLAKIRGLRLTGTRAMSKKEVFRKMLDKGESEETAEETADWLEDIGAINDADYAAMIVRHYSTKGYGVARIRNEFYRRGIPKDLWDDAFEELPDNTEAIDNLVRSKLQHRDMDRQNIKKLADMLCRRGFSWEEIRETLRRFECELEDID